MVRSVAARPVNTGRFVSPEGYQKLVAQLKKKESQLSGAKKAVAAQKSLMTRAFFTPEGYRKAQAKLHTLEARVKTLAREVAELKHRMAVA